MDKKEVIQVSFGDKKGELVLTDSANFFVESGRVMQIVGNSFKLTDRVALEKAIVSMKKGLSQVKITSTVFEALHKELGSFEILL